MWETLQQRLDAMDALAIYTIEGVYVAHVNVSLHTADKARQSNPITRRVDQDSNPRFEPTTNNLSEHFPYSCTAMHVANIDGSSRQSALTVQCSRCALGVRCQRAQVIADDCIAHCPKSPSFTW